MGVRDLGSNIVYDFVPKSECIRHMRQIDDEHLKFKNITIKRQSGIYSEIADWFDQAEFIGRIIPEIPRENN